MRLILNADDFGASEDTVEATIACFAEGALTSATIMAGGPAVDRAVSYARDHPELGFGVHLQLVGDGTDRPLSEPGEIPDLVDGNGCLLRTNLVRARALLGRLPAPQLEREIEAQIAFVRDAGVAVTHVDSHRHVHKLPAIREALGRVLPRFGIGRVRNVQDVYLGKPLASPTFWVGRRWREGLMASFATTQHLYLPASAHDVDWDVPLLERCARLQGTALELGVHPGDDGWRADERESLLRFAPAARAAGHELISWRDV